MSEAERTRLISAARSAFENMLDSRANEDGKIARGDANSVANSIAREHSVIESIQVIDGGDSWDFRMDIGDRDDQINGRAKAEDGEREVEDFEIEEPVRMENQSHTFIITAINGELELILRSDPKILKPTLRRILNEMPSNHQNRDIIQNAFNEVNELEIEFEANAEEIIRGQRGDVHKIKEEYVERKQAQIANILSLMAATFGITELDDFFKEPPSQRFIPRATEIGRFIRQKLYDNMHGWSSFSNNYESSNRGALIDEVLEAQNDNSHNKWQSLKEQGKVDSDANINTYDPSNISRYHVDHITPVAELWTEEGYNTSDSDRRNHFLDLENLQLMTPRANMSKGSEGALYKKFVGLGFVSSIAGGGIINSSVIDGTSFWDANSQPI